MSDALRLFPNDFPVPRWEYTKDEMDGRVTENFDEWGKSTLMGLLCGMIYGGSKEYINKPNEAFPTTRESIPLPTDQITARKAYVIRRNLMEQRFIKISKAAIKGGVQVGAVAGIYSGTQLYLQMQTGKRTVLNGVAAGSLSACSLGLTLPGSAVTRLQKGFLGFMVGGVLAYPLVSFQMFLESLVHETKEEERKREANAPKDNVGQVIERLEKIHQAHRQKD